MLEVDADYEACLRLLKECADRRGLAISADCLMSNHIRLFVVPEQEGFAEPSPSGRAYGVPTMRFGHSHPAIATTHYLPLHLRGSV